MKFQILTIFPQIFDSYLQESILKRALAKKIISIKVNDIRKFTTSKHSKVDDRPFGGGPGMVLQFDPIAKALAKVKGKNKKKQRVILFSTRGKRLNETLVKRLVKYDELIFICGRYEGVDERVADVLVDEEISLGDFVLSGGELPALVVLEAVSRFIPGVLGKYESLESIKGSYPVYTRPPEVIYRKKKLKVPPVLMSGDHKQIKKWRTEKSSSGR
jgi:tRNA (guanine37-N1)-methyltransferase